MHWATNTWDESEGWIYESYVPKLLPKKYSLYFLYFMFYQYEKYLHTH